LAAAGAKIAKSGREIGAHGEVVEVCVLDDAQTVAAVLGADGVLAGAAPGTILVLHSTIRPSTVEKVAAAAAKRGVETMDVPVSGSERGAREKTMSYMAGGSATAFAKVKPLFETSGTKILHTGPLGAGIRAKIAHQLMVCGNMLSAYEGMLLSDAAGLGRETLGTVVRDGAAQSRMADGIFKGLIAPSSNRVFRKDLQLCIEYGRELGVPVPAAELALELLDRIVPPQRVEAKA
jgi:3-hydroxyisobutyrate dehydrogenase-like beta-hydroxyacid dehydrogenase